ncbi:MAG: hypothetical protein WCT23_03695 [Candidatus Neomarinimicrobiota bacterium]
MKKILLLLLIVSLFSLPAFGETYYVRGTHNSWGTADGELRLKSGLGGNEYYGVTLEVPDNHEFKIADANWTPNYNWGTGNAIEYNSIVNFFHNGQNTSWQSPSPSYVHMSVKNPDNYLNQSLPVGIMALSSDVITTISSVSDDHSQTARENTSVTVTMTTSQTLLAEENLYVRYTENNWTSSKAVKASGSGTQYTATINSDISDTLSYYVFTSTLDWDTSDEFRNDPDILTLEYETNNGANYSYEIATDINHAPVIDPIADQSIEEGNTLSLTITATDLDNDPLRWSASGFGAGIDTASVNGDFTITFTPDYTQAGRVDTITVTVSDGKTSSSSSISIDSKTKNPNQNK